jgi:soluble lytic murein transglycosylase
MRMNKTVLALCVSGSSFFLTNLFPHSANAELVTEKMTWAAESPTGMEAKGKKLSNLALQKKFESEKKWNECANLGKGNFARFSSVKAWVLTSWLHCAREAAQAKKTSDLLLAAFKTSDAHPNLLVAGPWKNFLANEIIKSRMAVMELSQKTKPDESWKQIEILLEQRDRLEKPQRAKVLSVAGELSQTKAQLKAAQFFFEQSLAEQEAKATRDKLSSVLFALNEKKEAVLEKNKSESIDAEGNFEERFKASIKANDLVTLMDDCIAYLKQYPAGRKSKWAQDKVLEVYLSFLDQNHGEKVNSLRDRALALMEKSDSQRTMEWARQLHRKSDSVGGLRLAEKALGSLSDTSSSAILLYIAGRSAQFLGDYKKAKKYFEQYVDTAAGAEDYSEVLFRLGLVNLRLSEPSSAIAVFEKLLQQKNIDRYELNTKYWLARSLQATNNTRALSVVDEILGKYPFSYYGLRLRMERSNGVLEWPTNLKASKELKSDLTLSGTQKRALDRAQVLGENGWTSESLMELNEIPTPNEAISKVLLAHKFAKWGIYPPAIRLVNDAGDLDSELRSLDIVNLSLPRSYQKLIDEQAAKQKLSPYLVRSLIRQESAFGPKAISTSNAYGLMQLIGPTAQEVATELGLRGLSIPEDVFLPDNNIQMGTYYIAKMIKQFGGNVPLGLAAYNAGPYRMNIFVQARPVVMDQMQKFSSDPWDEMWFDELPWTETSFYVKAILRNTILYRLADKAASSNPDERRVQFGSVLWDSLVSKLEPKL